MRSSGRHGAARRGGAFRRELHDELRGKSRDAQADPLDRAGSTHGGRRGELVLRRWRQGFLHDQVQGNTT